MKLGTTLTIVSMLIVVLTAQAGAARADTYGAIAFSQQTGYDAWSVDTASARSAETRALSSCTQKATDCKIVESFSNSCGALAVDVNNHFAIGQSDNTQEAQTEALNACRRAGGSRCQIRLAQCVNPPTLNARPGLWRLSSQEIRNGQSAPASTSSRCIQPNQIPPHNWVFFLDAASSDSACNRTNLSASANTIRWTFDCEGQVQRTTHGSIMFNSPQHYTGTMTTMTGSQSPADSIHLDGQWTGPCNTAQ
ncbi:MAG TPA: DUF4189 domain-containing protein [Candidatus Binataceae bacterium]|nr:DUF4189 domain-containing protein [Candidatus Binataceae bacterium]